MRIFTVRKGLFMGEHTIYDSPSEFYTEHPSDFILKKWSDTAIEKNDWVIADDGYVIQCLGKRKFNNKWNYPTAAYRFCIGTFTHYHGKSGIKVHCMYAAVTQIKDRSSIGEYKGQDKLFILYVKSGFSLYEAYHKAFNRYPTQHQLDKVINKNRGALMDALTQMQNNICTRVQKNNGQTVAEIFENKIVDMILAVPQLPLKEARETIKFVSAILEPKKKDNKPSGEVEQPPLLIKEE
ncbi:MAG: hypothetical protein M1391_14640 [Bacteroidetes bacterium]|nr:hypothetical protein [Bacteroidota bacterium]